MVSFCVFMCVLELRSTTNCFKRSITAECEPLLHWIQLFKHCGELYHSVTSEGRGGVPAPAEQSEEGIGTRCWHWRDLLEKFGDGVLFWVWVLMGRVVMFFIPWGCFMLCASYFVQKWFLINFGKQNNNILNIPNWRI